ncbi:MAG: hypothetical protein OXI96_06370 [Acidimicrobiaceae bacterium]|nr:hypothetical protein [Acidimicrobiaceae bacterium]
MKNAELWFLDASAFVKLITAELESEELKRWMRGRSFVPSDLLRTEARRRAVLTCWGRRAGVVMNS